MPYAWPGGYPTYFICSDGGALCHKCAKKEKHRVIEAIKDRDNSGWRVIACDINYEDNMLFCSHCDEHIESAYGRGISIRGD